VAQQQQKPEQASTEQQQNTNDQPGGYRIGVAVDQVFLSVSARSVSGGFAKDLKQENFQIIEDGIPQQIVNFYSEEVPIKVVLLIDASGSTRHSQFQIRQAAMNFAESLDSEDEFCVITFNYEPKLIMNWSKDRERLKRALESIYAKGATVVNDAIYVTFDDLLRGVEGKTAVIMLTDGIDTGSMVSFQEAFDLAVRSESMVYVVSQLKDYWAYAIAARAELQSHLQLIPKELKDDYILEMEKALNRLADMTGGKVLDASRFNSLIDAYTQVAEELKNQYYISYIPINKKRDGSWRDVEVQVNRGGVVVRTRQGYYAD
jgi:Ca-activated chloride channel family protein